MGGVAQSYGLGWWYHPIMPYKDINERRLYQREWVAGRREEWFSDKFCIECNSTENLELDHVDRLLKISNSIWSWSKKRREEELAKCVVRCKICHAKRTAKQARKLFQKPLIHGTVSTYWSYKCRCILCKDIYKIYRRQQYEKHGC